MFLELLLGFQKVVHVVAAQHEDTVCLRHLQLVTGFLGFEQVGKSQFLARAVRRGLAGGVQHRGVVGLFGRGNGMDCFLADLLAQYGAVAFQHAGHLVIAASMEFVVGHGGCRGVELVKRNGLVGIFEGLNLQRIGRVVYKHGRVSADFSEVDYVRIHILVVALDAVIPAEALRCGAERLNHLACPYLCEHAVQHRAFRHERPGKQ